MLLPDRLRSLIDDGVIRQVLRQLKSGKEASLYIVEDEHGVCAAKVYKEAQNRSFQQRQDYVEGRRVRDSRQQRAMSTGSSFGKQQRETMWQHAEGDALAQAAAGGVRVPRMRQRCEGVLLMDLICDRNGEPAPQLAMTRFTPADARMAHQALMQQVARLLCAGLVHADLSEYNVLVAVDGLTIIDLPQAVDAARNTHAKKLLLRDIANVTRFFSRYAPELRRSEYGQEMWLLYEQSVLRPDSPLTGRYQAARTVADAQIVLREIAAAKAEAAKRAEVAQWREQQRLEKIQRNR